MVKGKKHTKKSRDLMKKNHADFSGENHPSWGMKRSEISIERMRKSRPDQHGKNNSMFGKRHTNESIRKIRLSAIKQREKMHGQISPFYNPKSISIIEQYGKEHGYNFQHAENGGEYHIKELGYWVDGYDEEKNVVIEYYEPFHKKQIERDERRQTEIVDNLKCKFIIINE